VEEEHYDTNTARISVKKKKKTGKQADMIMKGYYVKIRLLTPQSIVVISCLALLYCILYQNTIYEYDIQNTEDIKA
jgi:hypothetical protein